jgi:hypothetical protein
LIKKIYWFLFVYDLNSSLEEKSSDKSRPSQKVWMQDLSYIVLCSYLFFIFSPVIPLALDLAAHTFWKEKHLQTAHHKFGKNHVGLEIIKTEKRTNKEKSTNNQKASSEDSFHTSEITSVFPFPPERACSLSYSLFNCYFPIPYQDIESPPPRA